MEKMKIIGLGTPPYRLGIFRENRSASLGEEASQGFISVAIGFQVFFFIERDLILTKHRFLLECIQRYNRQQVNDKYVIVEG